MMMSMRGLAAAAVLALTPLAASAATVKTGLFAADSPPLVFTDGFEQGTVSQGAFEPFNNVSASFVAGENLNGITLSITINPYLTALSGSGLSNSISVSYSLNGGATTPFTIIKTGATGSATVENFVMAANDVFSFFVNGTAGRSGNGVTVNVLAPPSIVPLPAGGLLLAFGIVGAAAMRRRKKALSEA